MPALKKSTTPAPAGTSQRVEIQSVDRALSILEVIAEAGGELPLSGIASRLGLNASTCHHLVASLASRNYVVRGGRRGTYALGPQVLLLAGRVNWQDDLPRRAELAMDKLNQETGEAVHFAVLRGDELVTLVKRDALHALRVDTTAAGKAIACHATATGKAILAWMEPTEVRTLLKRHGMLRFTQHTITRINALVDELAETRRSGIAMDWEEFQPHVVCIGAAIHDHKGAVAGAISVSIPTPRVDDKRVARIREAVARTARSLSTGEPSRPNAPPPNTGRERPSANKPRAIANSTRQKSGRKYANG
jgi:IclR family transcriptional regulator, acetate operon repressor